MLPKFVESYGESDAGELGAALQDQKTGVCPEGHGIMIRARIEVEEPFYLERCSRCGGIWFDAGELEKIITHNLVGNLSDFWCKSWQSRRRKERSRSNYLESNRKLLGDDVFDEVMKLSEILGQHPEKGRAIALLQQEVMSISKS